MKQCSPKFIERLNEIKERAEEYRQDKRISKVNYERINRRIHNDIYRCFGNFLN